VFILLCKITCCFVVTAAYPGLKIHVGWETFDAWLPYNDLPYCDESYYVEGVYGGWVGEKRHRIRVHFPDLSQIFEMNNEWVTKYGSWLEDVPDDRIKLTKALYKETLRSTPKPASSKPKLKVKPSMAASGESAKKKQKTNESISGAASSSLAATRSLRVLSPLTLPRNLPQPNIFRYVVSKKLC
jgi:hypothetical protein